MGSFDVPWIIDPDPDQPKQTHARHSTHKRTSLHNTFFKPSYCNPVKVHKLGSLLSPQVRLTAANTLKIDILFRSFPV